MGARTSGSTNSHDMTKVINAVMAGIEDINKDLPEMNDDIEMTGNASRALAAGLDAQLRQETLNYSCGC